MRHTVIGWWPEGWKIQLQVLCETNNFHEEGNPSLQASSRAHSWPKLGHSYLIRKGRSLKGQRFPPGKGEEHKHLLRLWHLGVTDETLYKATEVGWLLLEELAVI